MNMSNTATAIAIFACVLAIVNIVCIVGIDKTVEEKETPNEYCDHANGTCVGRDFHKFEYFEHRHLVIGRFKFHLSTRKLEKSKVAI